MWRGLRSRVTKLLDKWVVETVSRRRQRTKNVQEEADRYRLSLMCSYHHSREPTWPFLAGHADSNVVRYFEGVSTFKKAEEFSSAEDLGFGSQLDLLADSDISHYIHFQAVTMLRVLSRLHDEHGHQQQQPAIAHKSDHGSSEPDASNAVLSAEGSTYRVLDPWKASGRDAEESEETASDSSIRKSVEHTVEAINNSPMMKAYADVCKKAYGFCLRVGQSSVTGGGYGVFLDGRCMPGQVLTLYPGLAYILSLPQHQKLLPNPSSFVQQNLYLSARYDGIALDGDVSESQFTQKQKDEHGDEPASRQEVLAELVRVKGGDGMTRALNEAEFKLIQSSFGVHYQHPMAVGHLINHSTRSNVMFGALDVAYSELDKDYIKFIPNRWAAPVPSFFPLSHPMKTMVLMASRPIVDEELFLNYRLNPKLDRPSWYGDDDEAESRRRWEPR